MVFPLASGPDPGGAGVTIPIIFKNTGAAHQQASVSSEGSLQEQAARSGCAAERTTSFAGQRAWAAVDLRRQAAVKLDQHVAAAPAVKVRHHCTGAQRLEQPAGLRVSKHRFCSPDQIRLGFKWGLVGCTGSASRAAKVSCKTGSAALVFLKHTQSERIRPHLDCVQLRLQGLSLPISVCSLR